ncbi:MAG: translation initiation factor IF-2, partial [Phycisphaerae bacterium]
MATRVFELARELGVTSKDVLSKCRAEGLDIKNHMTALSAGLEATIREWFSEGSASTAVETTEHVDLEEMRAKARRKRRKKRAEEAAEAEKKAAEQAEAEAKTTEQAPAEVEAEADTEAPAAETEAEETAPAAEQQEPAGEQTPAETVAEAKQEAAEKAPEPVEKPQADIERIPTVATERLAEAASPEAPTEPTAEAESPAPEAAEEEKQPEPAAEEPETEAEGSEEEQPEEDEDVSPAGPQVVPKPAQLQGPRVVRVERADYIRPPRPRPRPRPAAGPSSPEVVSAGPRRGRSKGAGGGSEEEERRRRGGGKRSPRRKGRSGDSGGGDRVKEWREKDLQERSQRLAAAGSGLRRHRANVSRGRGGGGPQIRTGKVEIEEPIAIKDLSAATGVKSADIIRRLMQQGMLATVNQVIETPLAEEIMLEYDIDLVVKKQKSAEEELLEEFKNREPGEMQSRPPVVTFLGHVDHGKTSLLDYIRKTSVAEGEAGGITQHIGAYRYDRGDSHVVFLDTPGHEAFTAMRARGANMTDIVVLVVAADDGVMPQTVEAISHAKAAEVPIVVALNKIDVPNANVNRALGQLAEHGLQPQEWGGDTEVIHTSAINGDGMDALVETLALEAELLELKAEVDAPASGYVIEAEMNPARGVLARILVLNGTLKVGDTLLAGNSPGRVRAMVDHLGKQLEEAGPATPVEVSGLDDVPQAGDRFYVTQDIDQARSIAEDRQEKFRQKSLKAAPNRGLESLLNRFEEGQINEVRVIIKTDVQGTTEAITGQLEKLGTDEVRVQVLHSGVGGITTGDVTLAEASDAIIIGFNVVADAGARKAAEASGVEIRTYRVI